MTTRRRLLLFGLLAGLLVLGVGGWLFWPRSAITRENAAKIEPGMTVADVEAIFGGPSRDETTGPITADAPDGDDGSNVTMTKWWIDPEWRSEDGLRTLAWQSDRVRVQVYHRDGRVTDIRQTDIRRADESLLDKLRRWFGL
jgi:hypothetical protein